MSTFQLLTEMKKHKRASKMATLFVDLKSAYNTIDRELLFQIIREKQILTEDESKFLELLYNSIYIAASDGTRHYLKNGV